MPGKPKTQLNFAAQLNQFSNTIQKGDLVVVPLKTAPKIALGEITGPCVPTADGRPMRPVRWLKAEVPRDVFRQDLLYSFGAFMTVCEISRNDALQRVEAVIKTGRDPGYESGSVQLVVNAGNLRSAASGNISIHPISARPARRRNTAV